LEVDLVTPATFNRVMIDEPEEYQRIEAFELQAADEDGNWKTFYTGSTIGPGWTLNVESVTARRVRLQILRASEGPTLWEFQLYGPK
jgi:alpha-L-fucosidase